MVRAKLELRSVWVVGISDEHGKDDQEIRVDNFSSGCGRVFKTKAYVGLVESVPAEGDGDLTCEEGSGSC